MKKTKTQCALLLLLIMFVAAQSFAQDDYELKYDNSGNRTEFNIVTLKSSDVIPDSLLPETELLPDTTNFTEDTRNDGIRVFPNPTLGRLTVEIFGEDSLENARVIVYNNSGVRVFTLNGLGTTNVIDLSPQPTGIYYMKIYTGQDKKSDWKIIKQ
jgi:hypothetical protein